MNRSKKVEERRGITLVALVITVIVMLIIAGVAISAITTNGVPFGKMQEAANKYNNEAQKEGETVNDILAMINGTGENEEGGENPPVVDVPGGDENIRYIISPTTATQEVTISFTTETEYNIEYKIGEESWEEYNGEIKTQENGAIYVRLKANTGETGSTKTINITNIDRVAPNEFNLSTEVGTNSIIVSGSTEDTASEGAANDIAGVRGYQYKINEEAWTSETLQTSYTFTGLSSGSYTVSMRAVDKAGNIREVTNKNQTVTITEMPQVGVDIKAEEDSTIDGNKATYANPLIPKGFKPINTTTAVWGTADGYKNGLVIQDATSDAQTVGSEFVWIPVPDYTKFQRYEGYESDKLQSYLSSCAEAGAAEGQTGLTGTKLEAQQMYASVKQYGGFYLARYEAGISRNMPQSVPSSDTTGTYANGTYKPTSIKDTFVWNYIQWGGSSSNTATDGYQGNDTANGAVKVARSMYADNEETTVTSTLCYGVQWDAVMAFIDPAYITSSCGTMSFVRDSTGKGNYKVDSTYALAKTGSSDAYYVNNISDLGGNAYEWTMEAWSYRRVSRGGNFNLSGSYSPASARLHYSPADYYSGVGFRGALYCSTES